MANQIGGTITWNLDVDDSKYNAGLAKAKAAASDLGKDVDTKFGGIRDSIVSSFKNAADASNQFATGLGIVSAALVAAGGFGIKYAADLETMTQGFVTLLGSTEKANAAISQVQKDAASTPFTFPGLVNANQLLTSVTKNSDESERLLLNVGKALTAMGKGQPELDRIIVNLQQIGAIGHASAIDIKQFAYAGIPIYDLLNEKLSNTKTSLIDNSKAIGDNTAKINDLKNKLAVAQQQQKEFTDKTKESTKMLKNNQIASYTEQIATLTGKTATLVSQNGNLGKSQADLDAAISSGKITFDLLKDTFNEAGEAGGRFSRAFIEQGGTVNQVMSNLQDNIGISSSKLVKSLGIFDAFKTTLIKLTDATQYLSSDAGIAGINKVIDVLMANLPIIIGLIVGGLVPSIVTAVTAFAPLIPFLAIGVAIGAMVKYLVDLFGGWAKTMELIKKGLNDLGSAYNSFVKPAVDEFLKQLQIMMPELEQIWKVIQSLLVPTFKLLGAIIGGTLLVVLKLFVFSLTNLVKSFNDIYKAGVVFIDSISKVGATLKGLWAVIKDFFTGGDVTATWYQNFKTSFMGIAILIDNLQNFFITLPGKVTGAINTFVNQVVSFFSSLPGKVVAVLQALPGQIMKVIEQMVLNFAIGLGLLVGIVVYGIPALIKLIVGFFVSLPGKILEIWDEVRTNIINTLTNIALWLVVNVPLMINSIVTFFSQLPGKILAFVIQTYNNVVAIFVSIWSWLTIIVPQIIASVVTFFSELPGKIMGWLINTKTQTTVGFKNIWDAIVEEVSTWPSKLFDWGSNIANSFVDGIKSAIGKIVDAFKDGLNKAKTLIEGHSPPIAGPFKEIDTWGFNVGSSWVNGVKKAISGLSFDNPIMSVSPAYATNGSGQGRSSGISGSLINIEQMTVRDDTDINEISRNLAFRLETSTGFTNG